MPEFLKTIFYFLKFKDSLFRRLNYFKEFSCCLAVLRDMNVVRKKYLSDSLVYLTFHV